MKERPITFTSDMVRAILEGRKTQTRRVLQYRHNGPKGDGKLHPPPDYVTSFVADRNIGPAWHGDGPASNGGTRGSGWTNCPYGIIGDRLWVREGVVTHASVPQVVGYVAEGCRRTADWEKQRTVRYMPRWARRITLEITNLRVERVQDISEEDAKAEGVHVGQRYTLPSHPAWCIHCGFHRPSHIGVALGCPGGQGTVFDPNTFVGGFRLLWDSINAKRGYGWDKNPWVWAITFRRMQ